MRIGGQPYKDSGDEMIEAAIREIEADERGEGPPVSGFPAGEHPKGESAQDKPEDKVPEEDPGVVLVDENNGAPVKIPKRKLKEGAIFSMAHLIITSIQEPLLSGLCLR